MGCAADLAQAFLGQSIRVQPVLPCRAETSLQRECAFLLKRCLLLPGIVITRFSFFFFFHPVRVLLDTIYIIFPAYQLDILIAETAPTGGSC